MSRRDLNHDKPSRSNRRPKPGLPRDYSALPSIGVASPQTGPKHSGQQRTPAILHVIPKANPDRESSNGFRKCSHTPVLARVEAVRS